MTGRHPVSRAAGLLTLLLAATLLACADEDETTDLRLEPVNYAGDQPFTPPAGHDVDAVTPPQGAGGTVTGETAGLYGGTMDAAACDAAAMVAYLERHPDRAAAWAEVRQITVDDITEYVNQLTPVVLRSDTAVTNHGFVDGRAEPIPAVLQAGTAVLVDTDGVPVTKCYCGNPLTPPTALTDVNFVGTAWSGFSADVITVVQQTDLTITEFTLTALDSGEPFARPVGSQGDEDRPGPGTPPAPPTGTATPGAGHEASWVVGGCQVDTGTLRGTVRVRNHNDRPHTYTVTVGFGPGGSFGEATTTLPPVDPDDTAEAEVSTGASGAAPDDGPVECQITKIVDETGATPEQGPPLAPPPPAPSPRTSGPTQSPTETGTPETTEPETTEPETTEPAPTAPDTPEQAPTD